MKQKEWKIVYTKYDGITKKAVNFLSKEVGACVIREPNVYRIYILPCEKEGCEILKNTFFVGCYDESEEIKKYVDRSEIPDDGFLVKVVQNPSDEEGRFVILTAHNEQNVFYAAVSFIDEYIPRFAPFHGANRMPELIFDSPLPKCSYTKTFDNKTRSIFTWGHSISDYRAYIDNMARLSFNELVLWNDYIPVNINDIIDYAHSYGIKVILGYSWGWKEIGNKATEISQARIDEVKAVAVNEYRKNYSHVNCDGIYFQSFTERKEENVGGKSISALVVEMVNDIANTLWEITPDLRIIFGLHATSVKKRLDDIAKVDPRMEILWEDCGDFPYYYDAYVKDENQYEESVEFTKKLLKLRGGRGVGIVFKGVMMLDWSKFINQHGPYIMGESSTYIAQHDRRVRAKAWRDYSAEWTRSGERALYMLKIIKENKLSDINMCLAGTFDGGIYLPMALCAHMYCNCDEPYDKILRDVMKKPCITVD